MELEEAAEMLVRVAKWQVVFNVLVELLSFVVNECNPRVENDLFFS